MKGAQRKGMKAGVMVGEDVAARAVARQVDSEALGDASKCVPFVLIRI